MVLLDGKFVSEVRRTKLKTAISQSGLRPGLAVVLVGADPASEVYVRNKHSACEKVGIHSEVLKLPEKSSEEQVLDAIQKLSIRNDTHGILVQLPLPAHLNKAKILDSVPASKDPDGLTPENLGLMLCGRPRVKPCTPAGVMAILSHYDISVQGKKAVVIGRSQIVGLPMAHLLQEANATVTVCHSKTSNTKELSLEADIVVVAAGQPEMFGKEYFKSGAVVIDVGIHRGINGLVGDVRFSEVKNHVSAITPVPGGVGPMTITMLLENTFNLCQNSLKK